MKLATLSSYQQTVHTERPVTAIAFDAGYEAHEAFTRAFRAVYATPPSGFRQRNISRFVLSAPCGVHFDPDGAVSPFVPRNSGGRNMNVAIEKMPELRVGAVRHIGPYMQINEAFATLHAVVQKAGVASTPDVALLGIYYDDPETTPASELRSDAGLTLPSGTPLPEGLEERMLPAGRYARTTHVGPYEQLGDVWSRLMGEWLPASGERVRNTPSYEIYRNTPETAPSEKLRTDLYIPLE